MAHRDPREQFRQAQVIAKDHAHYIVERPDGKGGTAYLLYRKGGPNGRGVYIGKRGTVAAIHRLVCQACNFH